MNIEFTKRFRKEFRHISNSDKLAELLNISIENILNAKTISEVKNL